MNVVASIKSLIPPKIRIAKGALLSMVGGEDELMVLRDICVKDEIAIDIGANRGVYAWHLRRFARDVIAFEPQPDMADILRKGFGSRVRVEQVALSDGDGVATLRIPNERMESGRATIESANHLEGSFSEVVVPRRRLDDYDLGTTGVIKIDVEGHELSVLRGAEALVRRDKPTLIIEAQDDHRQGALQAVSAYLADFGYRGFFMKARHLRRLDDILSTASPGRTALEQGLYNFIFAARPGVAKRLEAMIAST